jgi:anti-sigma factor RsiW
MSCEFAQHLSAYHDGELSPELRTTIEAHVATCPSCSAELTDLASTSRLFATAQRPHLSEFSKFRIRREAEALVQSDILKFVRTVRAIAACILVGASVWLWGTSGAAPAPEQVVAPPPQVDMAVAASEETQSLDASTPAAAWYLADASNRSDDQAGE